MESKKDSQSTKEERRLNQSVGMLPHEATPASHVRYHIAQALASLCPLSLGQEISVTGSISKGLADDASDIERVFYVQKLPNIQGRDAWLHQIGASEILHDEAPIEEGSI
jgi:predicted nucleotidyltransferase